MQGRPAIKVSDGKIFTGDDHIFLVIKALDSGYEPTELQAGNINKNEIFCPIFPKDRDLVPELNSKPQAWDFARRAGKGQRDAAFRLGEKDELYRFAAMEWDGLARLPIVAAIRDRKTKRIIFDYATHGENSYNHPEIESLEKGFLHDNGEFIDRKAAGLLVESAIGIRLGEKSLVSGQEWIPYISSDDEARELSKHIHHKGAAGISLRVRLLEKFNGDKDYINALHKVSQYYKKEIRKWQR
jgi:hypothetical protein